MAACAAEEEEGGSKICGLQYRTGNASIESACNIKQRRAARKYEIS